MSELSILFLRRREGKEEWRGVDEYLYSLPFTWLHSMWGFSLFCPVFRLGGATIEHKGLVWFVEG